MNAIMQLPQILRSEFNSTKTTIFKQMRTYFSIYVNYHYYCYFHYTYIMLALYYMLRINLMDLCYAVVFLEKPAD